ncbi:MAG: hypothetical protein SGI74_10790 [Oligoflexia bacterium]|nr:hypothetical protein [Oligoflexia bacterium]
MKQMIKESNVIILKALIVVAFVFLSSQVFGSPESKNKKSTKAASKTQQGSEKSKKYSTDFNFNDLLVRGEYAQPAEAAATVENEKELDDLLLVRKDFKDRLKQSSTKR